MNKKQQEEQRRQEDLALMNGLLWAAGAVLLEVLLFLISRYTFDYTTSAESIALASTIRDVLRVGRWVSLAAAAVCGVLAVVKSKKGQNSKLFTIISVVSAVLLICCYVAVKYHSTGMQMLYLLVPVLGGLALCYYIYQPEFFAAALPVVVGVLGLWFVRVSGMGLELLFTVVVGAVLLVRALRAKKAGNKTELNVAVVSAAAALAVQVVAAVAGSMIAYYLIFAMGAWLFALLVYYTVKMM